MKQRLTAGILLVLTILIFWGRILSHAPEPAARKEAPEKGQPGWEFYYSREINPFYPNLAPYHRTRGGYITGNCTWYAWGRACEMAGRKLEPAFTGDAGTWWEQNEKEHGYPCGSTPKRGAIICYKTHVGVVENTEPLTVSESGWTVDETKSAIVFHCGPPWRRAEQSIGYIYVQ